MRLNAETRGILRQLLDHPFFPTDLYFDILAGKVDVQAPTRADVRRVQLAFPGVTEWREEYVGDGCDWWAFAAVDGPGPRVRIYACKEAPPAPPVYDGDDIPF